MTSEKIVDMIKDELLKLYRSVPLRVGSKENHDINVRRTEIRTLEDLLMKIMKEMDHEG